MSLQLLPPINTVPLLETPIQTAILDRLFEPCAQLHSLSIPLLKDHTFPSYDDLIEGIGAQLTTLAESSSATDTQSLDSILGSHPRLGDKAIESIQSRQEQVRLAHDDRIRKSIADMNVSYEKRFPGLKYV